MQKEKLLKINSSGMKLCAIGLLIAALVQKCLGKDFAVIAGEIIVFFVLASYISIAYAYEGLWDEKIKPSVRGNLLISLVAAVMIGIGAFILGKINSAFILGILDILIRMGIGFIACFAVLSVLLFFYRKRRNALDNVDD